MLKKRISFVLIAYAKKHELDTSNAKQDTVKHTNTVNNSLQKRMCKLQDTGCNMSTRGGVEDTRLEAKAKDTKKI